jgi:hypothetical protein
VLTRERALALALALTVLYLLLVAYSSLAITVLQIRQQIGPDFDTIFELSNISAKFDEANRRGPSRYLGPYRRLERRLL